MRTTGLLLVAMCAALASFVACGSDPVPCDVVDECVSQCAEECGDRPVESIACRGTACTCICGTGGSGGSAGAGGMAGMGGSATGSEF